MSWWEILARSREKTVEQRWRISSPSKEFWGTSKRLNIVATVLILTLTEKPSWYPWWLVPRLRQATKRADSKFVGEECPRHNNSNSGPQAVSHDFRRMLGLEPNNLNSNPPLRPPPATSRMKDAKEIMKKRRERAICIDRVSRVLFPSTFVLLNIIYWLVFSDIIASLSQSSSDPLQTWFSPTSGKQKLKKMWFWTTSQNTCCYLTKPQEQNKSNFIYKVKPNTEECATKGEIPNKWNR